MRDFDEIYTARLAGYKSRDEYYSENSSIDRLDKIAVDTTIIAALDDPIICTKKLLNTSLSAPLKVEFLEKGGHLGFIHHGQINKTNHRWMDHKVINWVTSYIA